MLNLEQLTRVENCLKRRLRQIKHSPGADLTWAKMKISNTGKILVYRAHSRQDGTRVRGLDCIDYWAAGKPTGITLHEYE